MPPQVAGGGVTIWVTTGPKSDRSDEPAENEKPRNVFRYRVFREFCGVDAAGIEPATSCL